MSKLTYYYRIETTLSQGTLFAEMVNVIKRAREDLKQTRPESKWYKTLELGDDVLFVRNGSLWVTFDVGINGNAIIQIKLLPYSPNIIQALQYVFGVNILICSLCALRSTLTIPKSVVLINLVLLLISYPLIVVLAHRRDKRKIKVLLYELGIKEQMVHVDNIENVN